MIWRHSMCVAVFLLPLGCQGMPTLTRTGDVKDILVTEHLSKTEINVNPGDEVRWINKRTTPAMIIFLEPIDGRLSCKQGFGGFMTPTESATLDPNESASVCFHDPGSIRYAVKMKSATPSEDTHVSGLIRIGASLSKDTEALPAPAAISVQSGSGQ